MFVFHEIQALEQVLSLCHQNKIVNKRLNRPFHAILTSGQTREKLQCLYENLMSNNFRRMAVLKKI